MAEPRKRNAGKTKISVLPKVFEVIWYSGNYIPNKELVITTKQGTCGSAYRSADKVKAAEFVSGETYNFNFTQKQKDLTKDLVIVASYRIPDEKKTPEKKTSKGIGVVNFESESERSEMLILVKAQQKIFYEDIAVFANICSKLI